MAFYELETKDKPRKSISYFEVYYNSEGASSKYYTIKYKFKIYFKDAYEVSKRYGNLQDEFVNDLQLLQDDFYDFMYNIINKGLIKFKVTDDDYIGMDKEKKKVYDWFLPKQKAFADKWSLGINVD